ncbi:MAG: hypothetical protein ACT4P7_18410 [Gemmatimonadaceae bacterium]
MASDERQVFLNVPFDDQFAKLLDALVFTVHACGMEARCALERDSATQGRLERIFDLIGGCRYGIHDLSRTTLDRLHRLPRFNMPLELGVFLGAERFGAGRHQRKSCLILDRDPHRYDVFCSDLSGRDIRAHHNRADHAVRQVRKWLRAQVGHAHEIPAESELVSDYLEFRQDLELYARRQRTTARRIDFLERREIAREWLLDRQLGS